MDLGFLSLILIFISSCILSWSIASFLQTKNKKTPPPKAKGAWQIIGHLHKKLNHTTLGDMSDEYGPIFTVQLGLTQAVVVSSSEVAKEIFTNHDLAVSSRPSYTANYYFGYNIMFGLAPYGPYWREMRKVPTVHLLSNAKLELMKHVRVFEVENSIRELYKLWRQEGSRDKTSCWVSVELNQWILDMTFNIIVRIVAGKRFYGSTTVQSTEARRCQAALKDFFDMLGVYLLGDFIPFLKWLDLGGYEKSMKKSSKELDSILQGWIDEHRLARQKFDNQLEKVDQADFMDVLMTTLDGNENLQGYDVDAINKATCINLILGGSDTTTATITWAISLLLNNRQSLQKAQDELDNHVGKDQKVNESHIPDLPYLQAIVKETMRLYPAAPLSAPRRFDEDCDIGSYHITKGSWLMVNLYKIHRDPSVWSDPLEFRPERFLTTHKEIDVSGRISFEWMPFGSGRRSCPGASFGLSVVHLGLASFLHSIEFSTTSDAGVDMEEGFAFTVHRANPLNVLLRPRLPANLYA